MEFNLMNETFGISYFIFNNQGNKVVESKNLLESFIYNNYFESFSNRNITS